MILSFIDWAIIAAYLVVSLVVGLYMSRRAGRDTGEFFLSGRKLPWYIAGTSMVATTFAADTPLAVTELVAQSGISGNWLWWNMLFGGMLTVFFFARLWRRADILTDTEFVKIRYSGPEARFLRGFRAVYIGVIMNTVVIAWVNLAMVKVLEVMFPSLAFFGHTEFHILGLTFSAHLVMVALLLVFVTVYSSLSGLWGVSITDTFQFVMAMGGSIVLAVFAIRQVGGIEQVKAQLESVPWVFEFFPAVGESSGSSGSGLLKMSVVAFVAYLGVQWWASWYPGAEPGGGGYIAQRMMSAKDEKHSLLATLWFQVAHYAVRPWPWIIVALCALILYPSEADKGATYVMMIRDLMPSGLLGLLLAAFFAAYMSTISSQTVWGASYVINDLFRPFIKKDASERYYVKVSRVTTFIIMLLSLIVTTQFNLISDAWKFVLACSGGIGLVLLLRWFWWRINAWSELSAMIAPYFIYPILKLKYNLDFETSLLIIVMWSTLVWLTVTFLTRPADRDTLHAFYTKVHPGGVGWKQVASELPGVKGDTGYVRLFVNWILGCALVLLSLIGTGKIIFGEYLPGVLYFVFALTAATVIYRNLSKAGWGKVIK
ncbi:MAG TPA: sodium:solute symporter family protein [Prolixibacteraceae bacterium]|nr:sodium:solute symporter family protein [Prolixibacteraceae bacterium]